VLDICVDYRVHTEVASVQESTRRMEFSSINSWCQLHIPADLLPGKESPVPLELEAACAPQPLCKFGDEKKLLPNGRLSSLWPRLPSATTRYIHTFYTYECTSQTLRQTIKASIIIIIIIIIIIFHHNHYHITQSVSRQIHTPFQRQLFTDCDLVLSL
jgi:hypothetical protein